MVHLGTWGLFVFIYFSYSIIQSSFAIKFLTGCVQKEASYELSQWLTLQSILDCWHKNVDCNPVHTFHYADTICETSLFFLCNNCRVQLPQSHICPRTHTHSFAKISISLPAQSCDIQIVIITRTYIMKYVLLLFWTACWVFSQRKRSQLGNKKQTRPQPLPAFETGSYDSWNERWQQPWHEHRN